MLLLCLLLVLVSTAALAAPPPFCAALLGEFPVHASNSPRFGTPVVSGPDGAVYVCYITPALETVVRRSSPQGQWSAATVLDPRTSIDEYHTQCSLGIDPQGYVHAAYNMHNTPWQYSVSAQPHSVATMTFKGQPAGSPPSRGNPENTCATTEPCATDFSRNEPGVAAIPGNQVTYPHFGTTSAGALFVAFRECLQCDKSFHDRQWSAGLAQYHVQTGTWSRVAGIRPFATTVGKLPLGVRLAGDAFGGLHAAFIWCNPYNAAEGGHGCFDHANFVSYARSRDLGLSWQTSTGAALTLPLAQSAAEQVVGPEWFDRVGSQGYYSAHVAIAVDGLTHPTITVFPQTPNNDKGINRAFVTRTESGWSTPPQVLSYSPSLVYRDRLLRWIAVSGGLRIHVSTDDRQTWTLWPLDLDSGAFTFAVDAGWLQRTGHLRLYANNKTTGKLRVWSLTFPDSGVCAP